MNNTASASEASRIVLAARAAASFEVPARAAIQCVAGTIWLTQEGDQADYVVPAGAAFCTDRRGRVVVSATDGEAVLRIHEAAPYHYTPGAVSIDSLERMAHAARAAQARYVAGFFARIAQWLWDSATRRGARSSTTLPLSPARREAFRGYVRSL